MLTERKHEGRPTGPLDLQALTDLMSQLRAATRCPMGTAAPNIFPITFLFDELHGSGHMCKTQHSEKWGSSRPSDAVQHRTTCRQKRWRTTAQSRRPSYVSHAATRPVRPDFRRTAKIRKCPNSRIAGLCANSLQPLQRLLSGNLAG